MSKILAWSDGACSGNPGPAGWAYVLIDPDTGEKIDVVGGFHPKETNIQMELQAVVSLTEDKRVFGKSIVLSVDYIGIKHWIEGTWKISNANVYEKVERILNNLSQNDIDLTVVHTKGHSTDKWNNYVDLVAKQQVEIAKKA